MQNPSKVAQKNTMSTQLAPSLFGISRSNRNFADPYYWGKNQFNSAFPVALACYMRSRGIALNYVKFKDVARTEVTELAVSDLFGSSEPNESFRFLLKPGSITSDHLFMTNFPLLIW